MLLRLRGRNAFVAALVLAALTTTLVAPTTQVSAAGTVTVAGTFRYGDVDPDSNAVTLRPIAFAKVEIWRFRARGAFGIWSWANDRTATTDVNGSISEAMSFVGPGVTHAVRVFATNYAAVVWPNDAVHTLPFHREPDQPGAPRHLRASSAQQVLNFSFDFTERWAAQHYNIAETIRRGHDYAVARRDPRETDPLPAANAQPTSLTTSSWYNPTADTVAITSGQVFGDLLILHEYAHFVEEQISSFAWIPSGHDGCTATSKLDGHEFSSPDHAWMEGFADYYAQAVGRSLPTGTLGGRSVGGTPSASVLEHPSCPDLPADIDGDAVEHMVAATLWDLFDRPTDRDSFIEAHDRLARFDQAVFQIFDHELDVYGTAPTISAFRSAWMSRGLPGSDLSRIFVRHGIPLLGNYPPISNAGADQVRPERTTVTLSGRASDDPDLDPLTFSWRQLGGPAVTLANATSVSPSFVAPAVGPTGATLVFELVVHDGGAGSAPDRVTVNVTDAGPVSAAPGAHVVEAGTLRSGSARALSADDNVYLALSSTTSAIRTTSWLGRFTNVPNALSGVWVTYRGKNSQTCAQSIAVRRWTDGLWVRLDRRLVGTAENTVRVPLPGRPADYVSGTAGNGEVRVRVSCTNSSASFVAAGDLMRLRYDIP